MKKLLFIIFLFSSLGTVAQSRCVGNDTLCINPIPLIDIACASDTEYISTLVSSSVSGGTISYKWKPLRSPYITSTDSIFKFYAGFFNNIDNQTRFLLEVSLTANGKTYIVKDTFIINVKTAISRIVSEDPICVGSTPVNLSTYAKPLPVGGSWACLSENSSGYCPVFGNLLKTDSVFNWLNLLYIYNDNGCDKAIKVNTSINTAPNLEITAYKYQVCEDEHSVQLFSNYLGGIWSNNVDASERYLINTGTPGEHNTVTCHIDHKQSGCSADDTLEIYIQKKPTITLRTEDKDTIIVNSFYDLACNYTNAPGIKWYSNGDGRFLPNDTVKSVQYLSETTDTGFYTLSVKTDFAGCPQAVASKVVYGYDPYSKISVQATEVATNITIYPNPASSQITLSKGVTSSYIVQLISTDGKLVNTYNWATQQPLTIDVSQMNKGIYYLLLIDKSGTQYYKKLVIS